MFRCLDMLRLILPFITYMISPIYICLLLSNSMQANRMQFALDVVVRLMGPLCNGVARGWKGIRGSNMLRVLRNVRASRQMLTNLMAFAVNTMSLSLSTVQGMSMFV